MINSLFRLGALLRQRYQMHLFQICGALGVTQVQCSDTTLTHSACARTLGYGYSENIMFTLVPMPEHCARAPSLNGL